MARNGGPRRGALRTLLMIRATTLDRPSRTIPPGNMPPQFGGFVDLTGSDDEVLPSSSSRTRPSSQCTTKGNQKSSLRYVTHSGSKTTINGSSARPRNGLVERITLSPDSSTSTSASKPWTHTKEFSKTDLREKPRNSQEVLHRKSVETSRKTPDYMNLTKRSSQKPSPRKVSIIDDDDGDVFPPLSQFQTPRGLNPDGSQQISGKRQSLRSPFGGSVSSRAKRPKEEDSSIDDLMPSKKQKTSHGIFERKQVSTKGLLASGPSKNRPARSEDVVEIRSPLKPGAQAMDGRTSIDLTSPSRSTPKSGSLSQQDKGKANSPRSRKSQLPIRATNGDLPSSVLASKGVSQPKPSDDHTSTTKDHSSRQRSPSETSRSSNSRHRQTHSNGATNGTDGADNVDEKGSVVGRASTRETTPRIRKETHKAQALSSDKKAKHHSDQDMQTPPNETQANGLQSPVSRKTNGSAEQSLRETPQSTVRHTSRINRDRRINASAKSPNSALNSKDARGSSTLADQDDHSVSLDGRDELGDSTPGSRRSDVKSAVRHIASSQASWKAHKSRARHENTNVESPRKAASPNSSIPTLDANGRPTEANVAKDASKTPESRDASFHNRNYPKPTSISPPNADRSTGMSRNAPVQAKTPVPEAGTMVDEADLQLRSEAMENAEKTNVVKNTEKPFALPMSPASAMRTPSLYSKLPLAYQVEKVLGKYLEELREDNEYWTSTAMKRARLAKDEKRIATSSDQLNMQSEELTSFAKLQPLKFSLQQKGSVSAKTDQLWGIEKMGSGNKSSGPTWMSVPCTTFSTDTPDVPNYAHYVSIKNNILAPNVTNLHCWPYFGDEFDMNEASNLNDQYNVDIVHRERKLLLLLQAQKYEEYVESALQDLGCSWADVLRFLLELQPDVGGELDAKKALQHRQDFCDEDFSRTAERWEAVLSNLPPSSPEKLARVAVLCHNFQKMAKFSLWHVARRSEFAKVMEQGDSTNDVQPADDEMTCRICMRFNCPYHGEMREQADSESDDDSGSAVDSVVATDVVHPQRVNYRTRVAFPQPCTAESKSKEDLTIRSDRRDPKYWRSGNFQHLPDERGPFYPCSHRGTSCEDAKCSCFQSKLPCEKVCGCASDCRRKFQGCACSTERLKKGQKGCCFEDERCACFQVGRECDPDLCGSCGACEVVDPVNRLNDNILAGRCRNCSIQRGVPKQTLLGDSGVHGLGLYTCESIREHDFVGEYKGEIITKDEAERRGAVYEYQKLSYLFSLNATQEIDSTYFGNKVRFINHASGNRANLYPRIIMVNTVHRIALYANCNIKPGQELLFDYGPKFPDEQLGGKKSKKSAPRVRNSNLVRNEFWDVEESEDEVGNLRAKGVSRASKSRSKAKSRRPRGGARPGAGRKPRDTKADQASSFATGYTEQDAQERLMAYNLRDDQTDGGRSDLMEQDMEGDARDEDDSDPDVSEYGDSEASSESERSGSDEDGEEEEAEKLDTGRGRRYAIDSTARRGRR